MPAPGQGAMAVQCRAGDARMLELLALIDDPLLRRATDAEREFLRCSWRRLRGAGCRVCRFSEEQAGRIFTQGRVISLDGRRVVERRKVRAMIRARLRSSLRIGQVSRRPEEILDASACR